jgi:trimeric autotransporter adhesin
MRISITCICALLIGLSQAKTLQIDAAITDAQWTGMGQAQGFTNGRYGGPNGLWIDADGTVYVYADGSDKVGGMVLSDFVKWDGCTWSEWSGTKAAVGGLLYNLFTNGNDSLYGAMYLDNSGSSSVIAKWDGSAWHVLEGRFNGKISNLVVTPSGIIYVSGKFNSVGEISAYGIAQWDGGTWKALGNGIRGDGKGEGSVRALVSDD